MDLGSGLRMRLTGVWQVVRGLPCATFVSPNACACNAQVHHSGPASVSSAMCGIGYAGGRWHVGQPL